MRLLLILLCQILSCEAETSCSVKPARTRCKLGGSSLVDAGLTGLFRVRSEFVDGVGRGFVGAFESPEGFRLQSFSSVK